MQTMRLSSEKNVENLVTRFKFFWNTIFDIIQWVKFILLNYYYYSQLL